MGQTEKQRFFFSPDPSPPFGLAGLLCWGGGGKGAPAGPLRTDEALFRFVTKRLVFDRVACHCWSYGSGTFDLHQSVGVGTVFRRDGGISVFGMPEMMALHHALAVTIVHDHSSTTGPLERLFRNLPFPLGKPHNPLRKPLNPLRIPRKPSRHFRNRFLTFLNPFQDFQKPLPEAPEPCSGSVAPVQEVPKPRLELPEPHLRRKAQAYVSRGGTRGMRRPRPCPAEGKRAPSAQGARPLLCDVPGVLAWLVGER